MFGLHKTRAEPAVEPVGGKTPRPVSDYQRQGSGALAAAFERSGASGRSDGAPSADSIGPILGRHDE